MREKGYKIMISPYIKYYVRSDEYKDDKILGKRVFINVNNRFVDLAGYLMLLKFFKK